MDAEEIASGVAHPAAAAAAEEAPLTQDQWRDLIKNKEKKSQRAQRRLDECAALVREAKLAHFRSFARHGARACGRPFCARPSRSNSAGRVGGAGRRVAGFVIMAQARLARRHAGRPVRSDTLISTVKSIQRSDFPARYGCTEIEI